MSNAFQSTVQKTPPVERRAHPGGTEGAAVSLGEVAKKIREWRNNAHVQGWAGRVLIEAGKPDDITDQAQALLDALRKQCMYVPDPVGTEMIKAPKHTLCLDNALCMPAGDCFPKGTLLLRDDFEFVPVEDIKPGERIWGHNKWTTVEATAYKGVLSVDVLCLNNGSDVRLTASHKIYVARCPKHETNVTPCACPERRIDRIPVSEAKEDDVLLHPDRIAFGTQTIDPDRALIEGLYVSDGWSENYRFAISGQDGCPKEVQKRQVQTICERLGVDTRWNRKYIAINDPEWALRTHEMGLHAPEKHLLTINLDEAAAAASLRGVMADSGQNTNGPGRTFTTTSHRLMLQTRVLHKMFGLTCGKRYIEDHGGLGKNPIWRLGVRVKNRADGKAEKMLRIKDIVRNLHEVPCYDIQTEDHYVYLPEHDVTVSNCDDLSVALGAACMSVGIPVKVVGQAFKGSDVPSHVLIAVETKWGWKKVDPSHKTYGVGDSFPASREWWIDPLDEKTLALSGATLGDFIGVGRPPSYVFPVGVGELTSADKSAIYNTITAQLQTALFTLEKSVNDLGASLQQVQYTRSILMPGRPYDAEPFSITSLADFPSNGLWTATMATVATQIWTVGNKLVRAGHEALNGARQIFVDESTHEAYIAAAPSDEWSIHTILDSATQRIYGFFDSAKNLISGISAKDGKTLTPDQVQQTIAAPGASGTVQGTPLVGIGVAPAVIVIGAVVGVAIAGIAIYYSVSSWCNASKDAAREATNKAIIDCVTSGQCSAQQGQSMLDAVSNNRRLESEADAQNRAADPFSSTLASVGKIAMWTVIGGATVYGITLVAPMIRSAVDRHRARRLAT